VEALTIHDASQITGWSPRMLRYIERAGLVVPQRSRSGYRLYGGAEIARLRSLRALLEAHDIGLAELGFARRMHDEPDMRAAVDAWLRARPAPERAPTRSGGT
jgi:DNA-binding transcriptional MerR regulator